MKAFTSRGVQGSSPHTRGAHRPARSRGHHERIIPAYAGSTPGVNLQGVSFTDHPRIRGEHSGELLEFPLGFRIIPAYAGSTSGSGTSGAPEQDHPRIRGEHPVTLVTMGSNAGSSPHTRGAPHRPGHPLGDLRIIPAYAGSTSQSLTAYATPGGSSPHTRGAPSGYPYPRRTSRIIPAYAGSTHTRVSWSSSRQDHPRIRGEHAITPIEQGPLLGSSPHTRGARRRRPGRRRLRRIIPAYAGSTSIVRSYTVVFWDHPRIRGEHLRTAARRMAQGGSSPHTRGAQPLLLAELRDRRIIPAYAGSTTPARRPRLGGGDHPRIRGEHPDTERHAPKGNGSSPHTRGAHGGFLAITPPLRIIPAYAGSTPRHRAARPKGKRIIPAYAGSTRRGVARIGRLRGSSPHTRGARAGAVGDAEPRGIIPAYAGSTLLFRMGAAQNPDHPRIRGEHERESPLWRLSPGSSPHTRGARGLWWRPGRGRGIIPAYAGSTPANVRRYDSRQDHPRIRGEHTTARL